MIDTLRTLVAENGLIMRPGLSSDGPSSWPASGYGLAAIAAIEAAGPHATVVGSGEVQRSLKEQIDEEPIWGRWYAALVEKSTGQAIPGDWATGILNDPALPEDGTAQIAAIAAITDVVAVKSLPLPPATAADLVARLKAAAAATDVAYAKCRALESAAVLGDQTIATTIRPVAGPDLGQPMSTKSIVDLHGVLCAQSQLGQKSDASQLARIRSWLEPHLQMTVAGAEFEAYYLSQSWLLAGGEPARLQPLAASLRARIDPATGLLRGHAVRLGTLENTYFAAVLAESVDAADELFSQDTIRAVKEQIPEFRSRGNGLDLLMCAVILRYSGQADRALEDEAASLAVQKLGGKVDRSSVVVAARVMTLLQQIGRQAPRVTASLFPVKDAEDRYLSWTMLSLAPHLNNPEAVREHFKAQMTEAGQALASPDQLMAKEVIAALVVSGTSVNRDALPPPLEQWARGVRGCDGFPLLYRPLLSESRCTLEATVQLLDAGLSRP
ncbi:hypothetical protein AB0877_28420 [Micromonospora sp. NPDC047644]|uniref:hypothetical protein n=1 Tax=Micromonospora sp. NPDC047644 TaxID=3157203 RepID=UPI0034558567